MIDTIQMNEYIYDMDKMMWILMIWLTKYWLTMEMNGKWWTYDHNNMDMFI